MMKPILFNTEMVKAILGGTKTQTRRVIKPQPELNNGFWILGDAGWSDTITKFHPVYGHSLWNRCPVHAGDILYVRETWQQTESGGFIYRADKTEHGSAAYYNEYARLSGGWRPSIHMPKKAARIFLRVTDVRLERLRSITEADAEKEGLFKGWRLSGRGSLALSARQAFMWLWETITRDGPAAKTWACNPWVWVIEFERCEKPEALT